MTINDSEYVYLGFVAKAFGIKGGMSISFSSGKCNLSVGDCLHFVFSDKTEKALLVTSVMMPNRIFLESISDRNTAESFKDAKIYKSLKDLPQLSDAEYYLVQLKNFAVFNEEDVLIGTVVGFSSNNAQDLLEIKHNLGHNFYVPLVKELVVEIDFAKSFLRIKSLEGLDSKD